MDGSSKSLFRDQALDGTRHQWIGRTDIRAPRLAGAIAIGSVAIASLVVALGFVGTYAKQEVAVGRIVPDLGMGEVVSTTAGRVTRILVEDGEHVRVGSPLAIVSDQQETATLGSAQEVTAKELNEKKQQLLADLASIQTLDSAQRASSSAQIDAANDRIGKIDEQISIQRKRVASSMEIMKQWSIAADRGVVSKLQYLQQRDSALQSEMTLAQLFADRAQVEQAKETIRSSMVDKRAENDGKVSSVRLLLSDLRRDALANAMKSGLLLRAPSTGTVSNILVSTGDTVRAGQTIIAVTPDASTLVAELWVTGSAAPDVTPGLPVTLTYRDASYGAKSIVKGAVVQISRSATAPAAVSQTLGSEVKEARYRVIARIFQETSVQRPSPLAPGMPLEARIWLKPRAIYRLFLDPVDSNNATGVDIR
jgi:membrane fusion protein